MEFDGVDDYASVNNIPLNDGSYTISLWVNPAASQDDFAPLFLSTATTGLRMAAGSRRVQFLLFDESGGFKSIYSDNELVADQWSMVTAVYDSLNDKMYLYINGVEATIPQIANGLYDATFDGDVSFSDIGGRSAAGRKFDGRLDDIRVYDIAYTPIGIQKLYERGMLIGHWSMNDGFGSTLKDTSDYANDGTTTGGPSFATPKVGSYSLEFDGIDDYASVYNVPLQDGPYTISVWVKPAALQDNFVPLVLKTNTTGIRLGSGNRRVQFLLFDEIGAFKDMYSDNELAADQWSLVTAVYNDVTDKMHLYINGVEAATAITANGLLDSSFNGDVSFPDIGGRSATGRKLDGRLDDMRIYNRALTQSEIQNLLD